MHRDCGRRQQLVVLIRQGRPKETAGWKWVTFAWSTFVVAAADALLPHCCCCCCCNPKNKMVGHSSSCFCPRRNTPQKSHPGDRPRRVAVVEPRWCCQGVLWLWSLTEQQHLLLQVWAPLVLPSPLMLDPATENGAPPHRFLLWFRAAASRSAPPRTQGWWPDGGGSGSAVGRLRRGARRMRLADGLCPWTRAATTTTT